MVLGIVIHYNKMDTMNIFGGATKNKSKGEEVTWEGKQHLVDLTNEESTLGFIKEITGEQSLNAAFYALSKIYTRVPFINEIIASISDETLAQTSYRKFSEKAGNGNYVLYSTKQYTISTYNDVHYTACDSIPEQPINISSMGSMFSETKAESLDLSHWDTSQIVNMRAVFSQNHKLKSINLESWDTRSVTNMQCMFYEDKSLVSLDVSNWNTVNVTDMSMMFKNCSSLASLDVSNWNTINVRQMYCMFEKCGSLTQLDVANWDTRNVERMDTMFGECKRIKSLDVSNWNTSNVEHMNRMFQCCTSLETIDISKWDASSVTDTSFMFASCTSLKSLDLSGWKFSNLNNVISMFAGCKSLTNLDLSGWAEPFSTGNGYADYVSYCNFANAEKTMFYDCKALSTTHNNFYDELLEESR